MNISKFKVKKALLDHLLANNQGLTVLTEGGTNQATPTDAHLKESVLWGPTNITMDLNGRDNVQGIYQVDVCTPINDGDFRNLSIADLISTSFGKGESAAISHDGQRVTINDIAISGMASNAAQTHLVHYLSVNFRAV